MCWIPSFHFFKIWRKKNSQHVFLNVRSKILKSSNFGIFIHWSWTRYSYYEEYDTKSLYPTLVKCYHHLHRLVDNENAFVKEGAIQNCNPNFWNVASTSELAKELVNKELLIFKRYQMDGMSFSMVPKTWSMFLIAEFFACQILSIVKSQIKTKKLFSLAAILTNLLI